MRAVGLWFNAAMTRWLLLGALACSLGCGSDSDGRTGSSSGGDTSGADAGDDDGDDGPSGDPSETDVDDDGASGDTTSDASTSDDQASDDSSTGGMSGCEDGPLAAPIPGCTPTPGPLTGDFGQDCVDRINQFRWECQCLPPLARWADAESCTDQQSADDQSSQSPHGNFGVCGEYAQNTCPDWGSDEQIITGCLQAMWDEGPGEPFRAHGHYINMSSTQYTRVACGRSSAGQGVWSNQNFQ